MKTILLVDDDPNGSVTLCDILSDAGHHVIPRFDIESAITAVREEPRVDLVIMDNQVPRCDGPAFMSMVRQLIP
jgi:CheY-like chemotaxis protein